LTLYRIYTRIWLSLKIELRQKGMEKRIGVYAGSFDPPTNGHLWMIEQGTALFDEMVVAIGVNPDKRYTFSLSERLEMLRQVTVEMSNVRVASFENKFLVDYAKEAGAQYVLRGIRNGADYFNEHSMRNINADLKKEVTTVFLMPPREIAEISSSLVKGLIGPQGWREVVRKYVPAPVYRAILMNRLSELTWIRLWNSTGAKGDPRGVYSLLVEKYSEPHRAYHTFSHISHCLRELVAAKELADAGSLPKNFDAVELALYFHDAVYDPDRGDNEAQSAEFFKKVMSDGLSEALIEKVVRLILATRHTSVPKDDDAKLLLDVDLAILGAAPGEFDEYEQNIRKEYRSVTKEAFNRGREAVLRMFLERPNIYHTEYFRNKFEKSARENLSRSLAALSAAPK